MSSLTRIHPVQVVQTPEPAASAPSTDKNQTKKSPTATISGPSSVLSPTNTANQSSSSRFTHEEVELTPCLRYSLWLVLVTIVSVNVALLADAARTYHECDKPDSLLWVFRIYFLSYQTNQYLRHAAPIIAAGYALLAALFAACATYLVIVSIQSRRIHFGFQSTSTATSTTTTATKTTSAFSVSKWQRLKRKVATVQYLVSVRGPYFEMRQLLDDTIEMVSQTAAAVAASHSISNVGLTLTYGVVIFLTSIVPSVSKRVFRHSLAKQRLVSLVADLVLDFVWGSVLPYWMAEPVRTIYNNRATILTDFDSYSNSSREITRILVLSWPSYLLSVIPFVATLLNLVEILSILRDVRPSPPSQSPPSEAAGRLVSQPSMLRAGRTDTAVLRLTYAVSSHQRQHVIVRSLHALLPLYGLAVLATSIYASHVITPVHTQPLFECMHRVYPWFTADEACTGRRINCTFAGLHGSELEMESALAGFNAQALSDIYISDCSELTIPRGIHRFPHLQSLSIQDSHVVQWSKDAALTDPFFQELHTVLFVNVDFATVPAGIVAQPLPSYMNWMYLALVPNATMLLESSSDHWQHLYFFDCMLCGLTEFPTAVTKMHRLVTLQLAFNDIPQVPDDWNVALTTLQLDALWLDGNPRLVTLPDSMWRQAASLEIFSMEETGLAAIPEWLVDVFTSPGFQIFAAFTPLCSLPDAIPQSMRPHVACESMYK